MNYDQARQIEATGKWNWTSMNDGVIRTVEPCAYPDFTWPADFDVLNPPQPTGRPRCDHDTQEEAERHRWRWELSRMAPGDRIDRETVKELHRCDMPECARWADYELVGRGGDDLLHLHNWLCEPHLKPASLETLHPFQPGMRSIHS